MIQIDYKIKELYTKAVGSYENYVVTAIYEIIATEMVEEKEYAVSVRQSVNFEVDSTQTDFIPYNELTEVLLVDWVKKSVHPRRLAMLENGLKKALENQKIPVVKLEKPELPF